MKYSVYRLSDGFIKGHYGGPASMVHLDVKDGEEFYLNCPDTATHIINGEPVDLTTADDLRNRLRIQRNALLSLSDWTQVADSPLGSAQKAAWSAYRQALRDFPDTCDPYNPVWPTPPE